MKMADEGFSFEENFINVCRDYFKAFVFPEDFENPQTVDLINNWVSQNTHGKINKIIDKIPSDVMLYLINAIYFKAIWKFQFDKEQTIEESFQRKERNFVSCRMMRIRDQWNYYENEKMQFVDIPYGNGRVNMAVILPKWGVNINQFIQELNAPTWNDYLSHLAADSGNIELPKFTMEQEYELSNVLKVLGMGNAFDSRADFSRLSNGIGLYISGVRHKTYVRVDEEGTEAAAVTSIEYATCDDCPDPEGFDILLDPPFVFLIHDSDSGVILFAGKLMEPIWID